MSKKLFYRLTVLVLTFVMLLAMIPSALAASPEVGISSQKVILDDEEVALSAYNIDGSNYFRLRDLAVYLKDTPAEFSIDFANNTIHIERGGSYEALGTELAALSAPQKVVVSPQKIRIDGSLYKIGAYNIDGSNYFKLRDLSALGFDVDYDDETKSILIETTGDYSYDGIYSPFTTVGKTVEVGSTVSIAIIDKSLSDGLTVTSDNSCVKTSVETTYSNNQIKVTGLKAGTATVTMKNSFGDKESVTITVTLPPSVVDIPADWISVYCNSIDSAEFTVTNKGKTTLKVAILPGTYLLAGSSAYQNLLVTNRVSGDIAPGGKKTFKVNTCCMNIHRDIPSSNRNYSISMTTNQKLIKLAEYFNNNSTSYSVRQAAVWIVTDNASYNDCGILVLAGSRNRLIGSNDYNTAKEIVNNL